MDIDRDRTGLAVILIIGSVGLLSAADAVVKLVSAHYSIWQIYTARSLFSIAILAVLMGLGRESGWSEVVGSWPPVSSSCAAPHPKQRALRQRANEKPRAWTRGVLAAYRIAPTSDRQKNERRMGGHPPLLAFAMRKALQPPS